LPGHGGQGGGDSVQVGFDVGGGGGAGAVGVSGVGAGDAVPVVALDPGEGGVAQPVGGDAVSGDPGELLPETFPEVVVAASGERAAVAVAQQRISGCCGAAGRGVFGQAGGEGGADGLPADGAAFLPEKQQAVGDVEVAQA
jgi:hypothetical protein